MIERRLLWKAVAVFALSWGSMGAEFPQAEIAGGGVRAKLYLPDAEKGYYRGTRFDWSGVISSLEFQGHNYFGVWFPKYDPKLHDSVTGPVEEFRTGESGLGFEAAQPGGTFVRIGVGVLRRPDAKPFERFATYEIVDGGKWTVKPSRDRVVFTQELTDPASGYGYIYTKTVRLAGNSPTMTIEHSLRNTGKKKIESNVYNHNFFVIDGQPTGPDFVVRFPFELKASAQVGPRAEIRGNELRYLKELESGGQSVFTELAGFGKTASDFDIRVENRKTGAGVRVRGNQPISKIVYWSIRTVLSPEAYIDMAIEPGREFSWNLTYDFYTLPGAAK
jgi:hypothetical protein